MRSVLISLVLNSLALPAVAECADLALVLAIDASGSIDSQEFALQTAGYAAAFADPQVLSALDQAGRVDVATILWADSEMPQQVWPWVRVESAADARGLSVILAGLDRQISGNTGIGNGLAAALDLLEGSCAARTVINVSGDGPQSHSPTARQFLPVAAARARANAMGVTINALAIRDVEFSTDAWFEDHVITGPGAFVVSVDGFGTFAAGIARKLAREIALPALAQGPGMRGVTGS
jgi:Ca-activated chloride channel homolog